ncbi:Stk1 family PASTA domain-containing Ser/Thr kinase [Pueribacillus theae]|uniref:Serine/threonine-protein kinase PrkC n=1 Tax=Pueribacillus theae TaxID=2171751 RepID=A0A2U1K7U6_9BACI|nr:Stk1 family PASTA domain-containing Ser/Thr kinase [Pueribacillus theae]PWA13462.1 Stk1 family PASTA domain-containing Ser/Thr kinase [Pueribacillus theae]
MINKRLNERYKLLEVVGDGGMAIVYKAKDLILDRIVAVKVLRTEFSNDTEFILRFRREAESATSLSHPNIVNIFDVGEEDHVYYIVMEYVEGKTLKEYIRESAPLPIDEALAITNKIASAIRHAHENHIIHRDIKPHNILLTDKGEVKVTDFGIAMAMTSATITHTKSVLGSVHYFSPEQAKGSIANEKSDIYSLGVVLYEMVTGVLPFTGDSPVTVALKHLQDDFTLPKLLNNEIPQNVENIICKAMEKNPILRYDNVAQMQEDLAVALEPTVEHQPLQKGIDDNEKTKVLAPVSLNNHKNSDGSSASDKGKAPPKQKKEKKKKKRYVFLSVILLLLLGIGAAAFAIVPSLFYVKDVSVPDVTGKTYSEAVELLEKNHLKPEREEEHHHDVEEEKVIRQSPSPKTMVKENSQVTVVVSLGKEKLVLENFEGKSKENVERIVEDMGFKNVVWNEEKSDEEAGTIVSQSPQAGEEIVVGETVLTLRYSSGVQTVVLDNLIGMSKNSVDKYMENKNLKAEYKEEFSDKVDKNHVISQDPDPYVELNKGSKVKIVLSKGEAPKKSDYVPPVQEHKPNKPSPSEQDKKQPITFEVSQPIEIEDGREFEVVIQYQDAKNKNGIAAKETISKSKTYTFPLTVAPNGQASFQLILNGEEIKNKTYSYNEAKKME